MGILKWLSCLVGVVCIGCSGASSPVVKNIAKNLEVVIHPMHEDRKGLKQVKKVCMCATVKANSAWSDSRIAEFDKLLQDHDNELADIYSDEEKVGDLIGSLLRIEGASGLPKPSPELTEYLTDLGPFIAECEEKLGARVEF